MAQSGDDVEPVSRNCGRGRLTTGRIDQPVGLTVKHESRNLNLGQLGRSVFLENYAWQS